jgi:hypothetical protein
MKMTKRIFLTMILLSFVIIYASGQTIKERIDEAKTVKVYFKNTAFTHSPNTTPPIGSNMPGTGCEKFGETTPLPQEYLDAVNGLIEQLNTGFKTSAFIAGDFSAVPLKTSGIFKGEPDWAAQGESLIFFVNTWGNYNVKMSQTGKQNSMSIDCYLTVYALKDGKIKIVDQKSLASCWTDPISTQKCDDYNYFVEKFPANALVDKFKASLNEKLGELIEKDMKKYDKAMSKKK